MSIRAKSWRRPAPRFDPNWFASGDPRAAAVLDDRRRPLFDRAAKMAIPPGSVFKPLTALALVQNSVVDPAEAFRCQGYLDEPDRLRCQIFRHHGIGHGDVTLADALAQSCNVYFFHNATRLGAARLVDWAERLGFGRATGMDCVDEAAGRLPTLAELRANSAMQLLAVGQGCRGGHAAASCAVLRGDCQWRAPGYAATDARRGRCIDRERERFAAGTLSESTRIAGLTPEAIAAVRGAVPRGR